MPSGLTFYIPSAQLAMASAECGQARDAADAARQQSADLQHRLQAAEAELQALSGTTRGLEQVSCLLPVLGTLRTSARNSAFFCQSQARQGSCYL